MSALAASAWSPLVAYSGMRLKAVQGGMQGRWLIAHVQIYAFDRSFEGAIAACGAPLVGIIAEKLFGFTVRATAASGCCML